MGFGLLCNIVLIHLYRTPKESADALKVVRSRLGCYPGYDMCVLLFFFDVKLVYLLSDLFLLNLIF